MKKVPFTGAGVALVTPFNPDFTVNYTRLAQMLDWQIENKTDAIIICATTGEAPTLNIPEHKEIIEFTVKHVAGRVPVIASTGSNDTMTALDTSRHAVQAGADGLLMVTPYYNKTTQAGIIKHFEFLASKLDLPIILYNVPSRTGFCFKAETYAEISKIENIVAVKEASGDLSLVAKTAALCGDDLYIYSGNDDQIVPIMSLGGKGVISVLSNILPREAHDICQLYLDGKTTESRDLQLKYLDLCNALFAEVNPMPVKAAMNLLGMDVGSPRLPLCDVTDQTKQLLKAVLTKYGMLK